MPAAAEAVHGLSDTFLSDKCLFASKADDLLEFLGDSPLVAHNASFDFGFLNMELQRCGRPTVDMGRMVDTIAIARGKHPGAKLSLDALCTRYGIDRSHRTKHGALLDDLKDRVEAKRAELRARMKALKVDSRHDVIVARDQLKAGLIELDVTLKDGWDKASAAVEAKLNAWLARHSD